MNSPTKPQGEKQKNFKLKKYIRDTLKVSHILRRRISHMDLGWLQRQLMGDNLLIDSLLCETEIYK